VPKAAGAANVAAPAAAARNPSGPSNAAGATNAAGVPNGAGVANGAGTAKPAAAGLAAAGAGEGGFEVVTTPPGAALFVDGEPQGVTPARLSIASGAHKVVIAGEGQQLVKRDIKVTAGGKLEVALEAAKLPAGVAGGEGLKVRCKSHGEMRVFVDGADSGRACPNEERISVAAGPHKIGLYSLRTGEMHEVEHEVAEGNNSTRVYVKY
jgi:hypothetical protein